MSEHSTNMAVTQHYTHSTYSIYSQRTEIAQSDTESIYLYNRECVKTKMNVNTHARTQYFMYYSTTHGLLSILTRNK